MASGYGYGYEPPKEKSSPWLWVGIGCGGLALLGLCLIPPIAYLTMGSSEGGSLVDRDDTAPAPGPAPDVAPPLPGTDSRRVTVRVTRALNVPGARDGATCAFDVTRHDRSDGSFWCNAQIRCGDRLLYGGPTAGFFECTLYDQPQRHVVGHDVNTTSGDRDAAMSLDTLTGTLEVRDDATGVNGQFELQARVTSVL
ncbi:MAG: hypothetical protein IT378_06950 [Sandaracinaceae bacterium]|nr:hypothetical protein [Sandaracinaceae bacterium]